MRRSDAPPRSDRRRPPRPRFGLPAIALLISLVWSPALGRPPGDAAPAPPAAPTPATLPSPQTSPAPRHLTMADAIATGLASSPNLRQARARIDLARLNLDAVGVQMNPTLNLGSSYNYQFQPVTRTESPLVRFLNALIPGLISTPQGNPNSIAGAATLQMLVTTFGRVHWETQAARLALQQSRSQYRSQLEAEIQSIQVAYLSALLAEGQLEVARQVLADQQSLLENSKARARAGLIPEYDVIQFQSTVASAQQQVEAARGNVDSAHIALQALIGLPVTEPLTLDPLPEPVPPPRSPGQGLERALRVRPDLAALAWSVRAAEAQVESAARTSNPALTAVTTYSGEAEFGQDWSPTWVAGLQLQVPIMDGGWAGCRGSRPRWPSSRPGPVWSRCGARWGRTWRIPT